MSRSATDYQALTPVLKQAQRLGTLDKAEGQHRPKLLPQVLDRLGVKLALTPEGRGMVMSMYRAGFDCGEPLGAEEA